MRAPVPQSAGDLTPAGGGMCLPMVLNSWPMKPSGVQLARPILPPGLHTRTSSAAALSWSGVNMTPKVETTASKLRVGERQRFGIGLAKLDREPLGRRPLAAAFEQSGHVVRRDDLAPAPRRRQRDIAVAGRHVEDLLSGAQVERLAQRLADDLQRRAHDGVVAGGPSALLAGLDRAEVGLRRGGHHLCRSGCGAHLWLLWLICGVRSQMPRCDGQDFEQRA